MDRDNPIWDFGFETGYQISVIRYPFYPDIPG